MLTETYMPEGVRVATDKQWENWLTYLSNQQEHECPPECKGRGCHIELKADDACPSDWRHGL